MLTPEGMSRLETACGQVFGFGAVARPERGTVTPADALLDALVEPLSTPPCGVAFSGGRDSSLVLAAALAAARREGLAPPVPITVSFPADPDSQEGEWQERVISHIGVDEWVRLELPDGLDVVGPVAQRGLREHGPMFPGNAHIVVPMLERLAGGSLVAGLGGDELFGLWTRRHIADVAARRTPPHPRDLARVAGALAPAPVRRAALRRRGYTPTVPWMRPDAVAALGEIIVEQYAQATMRWDRHVQLVPVSRNMTLAVRDIGRIAALDDVRFHAPLLEPRFTSALARAGGWRGYGGRAATLRALFGHMLPDEILERESKATFRHTFFTDETRRFAQEWSGEGMDTSVVDPDVLRHTWAQPVVDFRTVLLLQSAWCHDHAVALC